MRPGTKRKSDERLVLEAMAVGMSQTFGRDTAVRAQLIRNDIQRGTGKVFDMTVNPDGSRTFERTA